MMQAVWTQDPVTFRSRHIPAVIEGMTMTPMPASPIPIWFGGSSDAALRRTVRLGDGWHGSRESPEEAAAIVKRLRAEWPGEDFTVSMRVMWDGTDQGALRAMVDAYEEAGVQHVMVAPVDRNVDNWDGCWAGWGGWWVRLLRIGKTEGSAGPAPCRSRGTRSISMRKGGELRLSAPPRVSYQNEALCSIAFHRAEGRDAW